MSLQIIHTFDSPLDYLRQAMWVSERRNSFLMTDIFKIVEIKFSNGLSIKNLAERRDKEEAYKIKKPYEERLDPDLHGELCVMGVNGFEYLSQGDYDQEGGLTGGSDTLFDLTNVYGVQGYELPIRTRAGLRLRFSKKEVHILQGPGAGFVVNYSLPFKSKDVTCVYGLHRSNRIAYGTSGGKIGILNLDDKKSKLKPIDDCKNVCADIAVTDDDKFMIACGMGYLKVYDLSQEKTTVVGDVQSSGRSIGMIGENILLNKGMHGLSLYSFARELQEVDELAVGFDIDKMCVNKGSSTVLVSSKPTGKLALIKVN